MMKCRHSSGTAQQRSCSQVAHVGEALHRDAFIVFEHGLSWLSPSSIQRPSHHILLSYTCNFMLWWAATTLMLLWKFKILKPICTNKSGPEGMRCAPCTQAGCCVYFHSKAVWKQAWLWSVALGSVGICCYGCTQGDHQRPFLRRETTAILEVGACVCGTGVCSLALKHHGLQETEVSCSPPILSSHVHSSSGL